MNQITTDLRTEYQTLADLAAGLSPDGWAVDTGFYGWTPWDEVAHLCFFDEAALIALQGPQAFQQHSDTLMPRVARGEEFSAIARERFGHLDGPALVRYWRPVFARLVDALAPLDAKTRLPWYGPSMNARSFASARLMETWAHGQDVYDAARVRRPATARLRHIAHIGAGTFGWSFVNRKLDVPAPAPHVALRAPDGSEWAWGEPSESHRVRGDALDFCLVVTQRRHVEDTSLEVRGEPAQRWMAIAQCFAGPPADGPARGVRRWEV